MTQFFPPLQARLTAEQLAAVQHKQGHARVLAVAGSGKTSLLIARVAWLCDLGVSPLRIRLLTYNREAAQELRSRMRSVAQLPAAIQVQTFHALSWRIMQRLMDMNLLPSWSLADEGVTTALKREALRQCELEPDQLEALDQAVEWVKSQTLPLDLALLTLSESLRPLTSAVRVFESLRMAHGVWLFSDMCYEAWRILSAHEAVLAQFRNHIDHFLVDEYQDVSPVQHALLQLLAGDRAQVMVVGDVDQCIYAWRGADPRFLAEQFAQDFAPCQSYHLTQSFRFGHSIALLANHVIAANAWSDRHLVRAADSVQTRLDFRVGQDGEQAMQVLHEWQAQGGHWREAAVLVRSWSQAASVELALLSAKIPYRLLGERSIWHGSLLQGVLAWLQVAQGELWQLPYGHRLPLLQAFWQLPPLGMVRTQRERLVVLSAQSPEQVAEALVSMPCEREWLRSHWLKRADWWQRLVKGGEMNQSARELLQAFMMDCDGINRLQKLSGYGQQGDQQVLLWQSLMQVIPAELTINQAVSWLMQLQQNSLSRKGVTDAVSVTTIHRVKGREWPCVLVAGLQDKLFPGNRVSQQPSLLAEERRLLYVAVTRAQRQLTLLIPDMTQLQTLWAVGAVADDAGDACRLLAETNLLLCQQVSAVLSGQQQGLPAALDYGTVNQYLSLLNYPARVTSKVKLVSGQTVQHDKFGAGVILSQQEHRVEVMFKDGVRCLQADHPALDWG